MSTSHEIVPSSEPISQTAQEGLGVGGQVVAKSEMPGIGHFGETRQPGQDVRLSTTPEVGQYPVETSQPVVSGSTSEMSLGAASDCDLKSEQMGGVQSKGQSSDAATRNPNGLDEMLTAGRKLQSVSEKKSVEVKLFEASKDSKWFDAIEKKNCKLLLQLFRHDRSLWVQTGLKGRSVLHVAVMQGCSELVGELYNYKGDLVPGGINSPVLNPFKFLWENARDGRLKNASAQDIWLVMEGPSDKAGDQQGEPLAGRSGYDYVYSHVMCRMPVDSEMLSLREAISSIASEEKFVMDENDVDFNFENYERMELYLHMACSKLRNVLAAETFAPRSFGGSVGEGAQIFHFIMAVCKHLPPNLLLKLFDQKDAQGRTILQVLITQTADFKSAVYMLEELLKFLPEACVNILDKAGRTVLHWAVGHDITWAVQLLLKSGKARLDISFRTFHIKNISAFHLMLLYDVSLPSDLSSFPHKPYWPYLEEELRKQCCIQPVSCIYGYSSDEVCSPLISGIVMGQNKFVKNIIETQVDYEEDIANKNQLLSYAAYSANFEILQIFLRKDDDVDQLQVAAQHTTGRREKLTLNILAFATLMGRNQFVETIMKSQEYKEYKLENQLLSYAAYFGNVAILQQLLQNVDADKLNVFCYPFKAPPLHLAVDATTIEFRWKDFRNFNDCLHCNDFISIELLERKLREKDLEEDSAIANTNKTKNVVFNINRKQYSAKQACANLLLQAGADILATDYDGYMANPGKGASIEAITWWYELFEKKTLNIRNNLVAAGSAIPVAAAIVATTSFVGPLTPPLNYVAMSSGTSTIDVGVQVTNLLIKVWLVSNSLSFYLAITSIMIAFMPSLPIPKKGVVFGPSDDLKQSRRTISIAIGMLLASIISVLISFAASSLVVVPLQHRGLMVYSTSIGGLICFIGVIFFFLRSLKFLRLIYPQNTFITKLYQSI